MPTNHLFNINGKPQPSATLMNGRLYATILSDEHFASALIWGALLSASEKARPAFLISDNDQQKFLDSTDALARDANSALDLGLVQIFSLDAQTIPQTIPAPSRQLLAEFEHFDIPQKSLLVVDRAELLFDDKALDNEAPLIREWRDWAEKNQCALLLLFRSLPEQRNELGLKLMAALHLFGGIARMRFADGIVRWEILGGFGGDALPVSKTVYLQRGDNGRLSGLDITRTGIVEEAAVDEDAVFAMKSICPKNQLPAAGWYWADNLEELLALVSETIAATVILAFDQNTPLEHLERAVFALRQNKGNRIKIVVRELGVHLRYNQEAFLIKLGANFVAHAELSYSRFLNVISMVQGQRFTRTQPVSYEAAAADALREQEIGYLPPQKFLEAVNRAQGIGRSLAVQNALIGLPLAPGLVPLDALRYCSAKRHGDFCTADGYGVYVFLSACREGDVDRALQSFFQLPVGDLFNSETRYLSAQTIQSAIDDLAARDAAQALPDFSEDLAEIEAQEKTNIRITEQQATPAGSAIKIRAVPNEAQRRPLALRAAPAPDKSAGAQSS